VSRGTYLVTPRPTGDGWNLTGPDLPFGLWFTDEAKAADHGAFMLRSRGGSVVIVESSGYQFTESVEGHAPDRFLG
jgi:hypothetical protein